MIDAQTFQLITSKMDDIKDNMNERIADIKEDMNSNFDQINKDIAEAAKFKWTLVGGIIAFNAILGFIISIAGIYVMLPRK